MSAAEQRSDEGPRSSSLGRPKSAIACAEASERHFVWKLTLIVALGVLVAWLGVRQVKHRSAGVRTAYRLAVLHDQLREQVELNRRHAAALASKKDPNRLRDEAERVWNMRAPGTRKQLELH